MVKDELLHSKTYTQRHHIHLCLSLRFLYQTERQPCVLALFLGNQGKGSEVTDQIKISEQMKKSFMDKFIHFY